MSRFWIVVFAVLITGLFAAFLPAESSEIKINDLETECRGDRGTSTTISLHPDNSLRFEGYFPVENTRSDISFKYRDGKNIVLDVRSQGLPAPKFLWNDCLASGLYDLQTSSLSPGRYTVEVRHNKGIVDKRRIKIRD